MRSFKNDCAAPNCEKHATIYFVMFDIRGSNVVKAYFTREDSSLGNIGAMNSIQIVLLVRTSVDLSGGDSLRARTWWNWDRWKAGLSSIYRTLISFEIEKSKAFVQRPRSVSPRHISISDFKLIALS